MAKQYQWRLSNRYGSNTSLSYGIVGDTNWHTETINDDQKTVTAQYWYRDSNHIDGSDANSTRVILSVTDKWRISVARDNTITVTLNTTIESIARDDSRGTQPASPSRRIMISRYQGGSVLYEYIDSSVNTNHSILGSPKDLGETVFTIVPGQGASRESFYLKNETYSSSVVSFDEFWAGVEIKNILPRDYRPGATLQHEQHHWPVTGGKWLSHNRLNGACHIYNNSSWKELRTAGGKEGEKGNPPLILTAANADSWRNQKLIGEEE